MYQLLVKGVGIALAMLIANLSIAAGGEVHDDGSSTITSWSTSPWRPFFHPVEDFHSPLPILFRYYYPTSAPIERGADRSLNHEPTSQDATVSLYGVPLSTLPWNRSGFKDYDERVSAPQSKELYLPEEYKLTRSIVSRALSSSHSVAVIVAHLPPNAPFWVEGKRTAASGLVRYFVSPPLTPGKKYLYTVRTVWDENGKWVGQSLEVPVRAGEMTAIYLKRSSAPVAKTPKSR